MYILLGSLSTDKRSRYSKSNSNPQKEYEEEFDEIKVIPSSSSGIKNFIGRSIHIHVSYCMSQNS